MDKQEVLYDKVKDSSLFSGLDRSQVQFLLEFLHAHLEVFEKGCRVFPPSESIRSFALILRGSLELAQYDYWGNRSIILTQETGECLGLPSTLFENWIPPADITSRSRCELMIFKAEKLRKPEHLTIPACALLKSNIAKQLALKNLALVSKFSLIHCRTTREKVSMFLSLQASVYRSCSFDISFSRQEMADFLLVNRSALSRELAHMQSEGLIEYDHNHFVLKSLDLA